ncbi:MAG: DNA polymerase III subunit psi, partial [Methylophaga sp.]|nr:DNA polymerase III subunit psi [Methylophaga sp.]
MMTVNLSEQQLWTLGELGIPVWQLRQNPQPETIAESSLPEQALPTIEKTFISNCQVLVCYPSTQVPAEQQLLANILKAMVKLGVT